MELRGWIKDQFGGRDTLLDESKYSSQEIKEDKIRLRQERKRLQKELSELGADYQRLLEEGAQANEIERKQYAQQAKIAKKKYKIKEQQYQQNSMQMATIVTIEGARDLMEMSNGNKTNFDELMDSSDVDLSHVQESMMDSMIEYELDMDMMMEIQETLDIDIIGADVDMGSDEELEMMEEIESGEVDAEQVDVDEQVSEDSDYDEELDGNLGMGGSDIGPDI